MQIVLCSNSLLMDGIESRLKAGRDLDVVRLDAAWPDAGERLDALHPDAIIFDLAAPGSLLFACALSFFVKHPGRLLIGLDVNCRTALVLSSQRREIQTASELIQVIEKSLRVAPAF